MINLCDLTPEQITEDQLADAIGMQLVCTLVPGRWGVYWDLETRVAVVRFPRGDLCIPQQITGSVAASDEDRLRWRAKPDSAEWLSDCVSVSFHVEEAW